MNNEMLNRITKYYRTLNRLRSIGLEKVFAHNLADAAGVSATIVRKDFSQLEIKGQKRGGYEIFELIQTIGKILGKGDAQNVIVVGCGRIGKALMHYSGFEADGIKMVAGFDSDPLVYSDASFPIPVYPLSRLEEVVSTLKVSVAIITVPENAASDIYQRLLEAGVHGILNFSPITLKAQQGPDSNFAIVHNINIALELEKIFYELQFPEKATTN